MIQSVRAISLLLIITSLIIHKSALAQEKEVRLRNNVITFLPQYAISYGIRMDYERRIGKGDLWILIGPQYYSHDQGNQGWRTGASIWYAYEKMRGWGINAYAKYITYKAGDISKITGLPARNIYVSAGPVYQRFVLSKFLEVPQPYVEEGITYYKFGLEEVQTIVNKVGFNINAGVQFTMDSFVVDFYIGVGYKSALDESGSQHLNTYARMIEPGYSGMIADGGFKIGFVF